MSIRMTMMPVVFAGLLAAAPVMAQPAATPATPTSPAPAAASRRDNVVERRIAELHAKLKITPAEQKPFDDFAQAMRDNAQRMDNAIGTKQANAATATAVEQMKAYSELAQAHAEEVNRLLAPFSTLYNALSPDQKKLADQSFREFSNGPRGARTARG